MAQPTTACVHVGDTGTVLTKTITNKAGQALDISDATSITVTFYLNETANKALSGSFVGTGSDGKIQVTTTSDTWTEEGTWVEQVKIVTPSGSWHSEAESRVVLPVYAAAA